MDLLPEFSGEESMSIISLFGLRTKWYLRLLEWLGWILKFLLTETPLLS